MPPVNAQIGYASETTYGTAVTPSAFLPLVSESIAATRERLESAAVLAGRKVITSEQWNGGPMAVDGDVQHELYANGLGILFLHMFGSVATSGPGPYVHEFTPGPLDGKGLTVQVGRPGTGGVVHPFTYSGCKVVDWEIACSSGEIATLGLTVAGRGESTSMGLATASYPSGASKPLKFNHASVTLAGDAAEVTGLTISGANGLKTDRRFLSDERRAEPLEEGRREYTGTLDVEFADLTHYNRFVDGTEAALVVDFTAGTDKVVIEGNVRFDGGPPNVGGQTILTQSIPIKFVASGALDSSAIKATLTNQTSTVP